MEESRTKGATGSHLFPLKTTGVLIMEQGWRKKQQRPIPIVRRSSDRGQNAGHCRDPETYTEDD